MKVGSGGGAPPKPRVARPDHREPAPTVARPDHREPSQQYQPRPPEARRVPSGALGRGGAAGRQPAPAVPKVPEPDAATRRLLQLTFIKSPDGSYRVKPGAEQFAAGAAKSLASRPGAAGIGSYSALSPGFASIGLNLADIAPGAAQRVHQFVDKYAKSGGKPVLAPDVQFLNASQRSALRAAAKAKGTEPSQDASDTDLVHALHAHKPGWGDVATNLVPSIARTVEGIPLGAAAAGEGIYQAVVHQNMKPNNELWHSILHSYAKAIKHPGAALQRDPAGTVLMFSPFLKGAGRLAGETASSGVAGSAAKAFMAERGAVPATHFPVGGETPMIERPMASRNLIDRTAQAARDAALRRSEGLQGRAMAKETVRGQARAKGVSINERDKILHDWAQSFHGDARHFWQKTKDAEATAALYAHFQGLTPSGQLALNERLLQMAESRAPGDPGLPSKRDVPNLRQQVALWKTIHARYGDAVTPNMQEIIDSTRVGVAHREAAAIRVSEPLRAANEPPAAEALPGMEHLTGDGQAHAELARIHEERNRLPQRIALDVLGSELNPAQHFSPVEPGYVPHTMGVKFRDFMPGRKLSYQKDVAQLWKKNEGVLMRTGRVAPDVKAVAASLARPQIIEHGIASTKEAFHRHGINGPPGTHYDTETQVLVRSQPVRVSRQDTRQAGDAQSYANAMHAVGNDDAAFAAALKAHLEVPLGDTLIPGTKTGVVPANIHDALIIPKPVWEAATRQPLINLSKSPVMRAASQATDAWRFATLFLRPAWLANNLVGNTLQTSVGMMGAPWRAPEALYHAARPEYKAAVQRAISELAGGGQMAWLSRRNNAGSLANSAVGRLLDHIAQSKAGLPIRAVNGFANGMKKINVDFENYLRRALYIHQAWPELKKMSGDIVENLANNRSEKAATEVARMLGDFNSAANHPGLRLAVPFYKWITFITKLTLWDLPIHHPARTAILAQLGNLGDNEYQKMNLGFSSYLAGAIPLQIHKDADGNVTGTILRVGGIWPFSTVPQTLGGQGGGADFSTVLGTMNPLIQAPASVALGEDLQTGYGLRNAAGKTIVARPSGLLAANQTNSWSNVLGALANQLAHTVPGESLVDNPIGQADNSLPFSQSRYGPTNLFGLLGRPHGFGYEPAKTSTTAQKPQRSDFQRWLGYMTGVSIAPQDFTLNARKALARESATSGTVFGVTIPTTKKQGGSVVDTDAHWRAFQAKHPELLTLTRSEVYDLTQAIHRARVQTGQASTKKYTPAGFGKGKAKKKAPASAASGLGSEFG